MGQRLVPPIAPAHEFEAPLDVTTGLVQALQRSESPADGEMEHSEFDGLGAATHTLQEGASAISSGVTAVSVSLNRSTVTMLSNNVPESPSPAPVVQARILSRKITVMIVDDFIGFLPCEIVCV